MYRKLQISIFSLPSTYFILWVFIFLVYFGLGYYFQEISKKDNIVSYIELVVKNELLVLDNEVEEISSILKLQSADYWNKLDENYSGSKRFILLYKKDSLVYWNNKYLSGDIHNVHIDKYRLLENQTGWYLVRHQNVDEYSVYLSTLIKSKFNISDELASSVLIGSWYKLADLDFTLDPKETTYTFNSRTGDFIFGIKNLNDRMLGDKMINALFIIYLIGFIILLTWLSLLYLRFEHLFKYRYLLHFFIIVDILIIRFLGFYFHIPYLLKSSYLFDKQFDILSSFNSVGDILINSIVLLFIAIQLNRILYESVKGSRITTSVQLLFYLLVWSISILIFTFLYKIIYYLPFDSFYGIDTESIDILFIFIAFLFSIVSLVIVIYSVFFSFVNQRTTNIVYFIFVGLVAILMVKYVLDLNLIFTIIIGAFLLSIYLVLIYFSTSQRNEFYKYLIIIVILSSISTFTINSSRKNKKDLHQTETLKSLSKTKDNLLEKTFEDFVTKIDKDSNVLKETTYSLSNNKSEFEEYLLENYFNNVREKYDIQITICLSEDMLELQPEGFVVNCSEYFEKYIDDIDKIEITENLCLIPEKPESRYYFGRKRIQIKDSELDIYFEFYFTYVPEGLGYPELLVSEAAMDIDLSGYSIAKYSDDQLAYKYGDFPYHTNLDYMENYAMNTLFNLNGFRHIKRKLADDSFLIISRPNEKFAVQLVSFSILFITFVLLIFLISLVFFRKQALLLFQMSFQNRLQIIFVSAISIIIMLLASVTLFYINVDNQDRLTKQLTERTNSVIIEIQHKLSDAPDLYSIDPIELEMLLKKFSLVFFSDINLYSPSGELISSSRPEIFKRGLLSENINPKAYKELFINNKLFFIIQEDLGSITYYSTYAPLMLSSSQPAGIINLPYFAKQSEVTRSYYQMIFTFINLFVFLAIVGTLIVLILSRIITKPLVVLQKNLTAIQIDKQNEIIEWKSNDEIGQLINAYNQMIHKLEQSTEMLKQSERESAWREVAQQIAHEIKNPLTPMKLNVQYLEKAFRENDPGLGEKVKNISEMLIAQIDTLNKVAEMFSDFTKAKSRKFEKVDLESVIKKAIQLFKNHSDTKFTFSAEPGNYYTNAFEKDLLRVFNNLIKNSLQSMNIHDERDIIIKLSTSDDMHIVEFTDNGKGISEEIKHNIFKPYFTTKSTGTGLGLAIVKNIMNEIGGEITLESSTSQGTRFVLQFKVNQ